MKKNKHILHFTIILIFGIALVSLFYFGNDSDCSSCSATVKKISVNPKNDELITFFINQAKIFFTFYIIGGLCGWAVENDRLSKDISKKIAWGTTSMLSLYYSIKMASCADYYSSITIMVCGLIGLLLILVPILSPLRRRISFFRTMFSSLYHPDDKGKTLLLLSTEAFLLTIIVTVCGIYYNYNMNYWNCLQYQEYHSNNKSQNLCLEDLFDWNCQYDNFIPVFSVIIANFFAGIIGKKWGHYQYKFNCFFTRQPRDKTIEGSIIMFFATMISILCIYILGRNSFQIFLEYKIWLFALIMTIVESKAPHLFVNPFLYFIGFITLELLALL